MDAELRRQRVERYRTQREIYLRGRMLDDRLITTPHLLATIIRHRLTGLLVVLSVAPAAFVAVLDMLYLIGGDVAWADRNLWLMTGAVVVGAVVTISVLVGGCWVLRATRSIGSVMLYALGSAAALSLIAASWAQRVEGASPGAVAILLACMGSSMALLSGLLGADLIDRMRERILLQRPSAMETPTVAVEPATLAPLMENAGIEPVQVAQA